MIPLDRNIQARLGDEFCIVRNFLNDGSIEVIWKGGEVFTCQLGDLTIDLFNLSELLTALEHRFVVIWIRDREDSEDLLKVKKITQQSFLVINSSLKATGLSKKQSDLIVEYVKTFKPSLKYSKMCLFCIDLVDLYRKMSE